MTNQVPTAMRNLDDADLDKSRAAAVFLPGAGTTGARIGDSAALCAGPRLTLTVTLSRSFLIRSRRVVKFSSSMVAAGGRRKLPLGLR
jgi:hypothetical protein